MKYFSPDAQATVVYLFRFLWLVLSGTQDAVVRASSLTSSHLILAGASLIQGNMKRRPERVTLSCCAGTSISAGSVFK